METTPPKISDAPTTAVTGQDCPLTGLWQAPTLELPPLLVRQGDIMPAAFGRVVTWELLHPEPLCDADRLGRV